jgi:hypothetical protein
MKSKIEFSKIEKRPLGAGRGAKLNGGGDNHNHSAPPSITQTVTNPAWREKQILFGFLEEIPPEPRDSGKREALRRCRKTIDCLINRFIRTNRRKQK